MFKNVVTADVKYSTNRELFASNNDNFLQVFEENVDLINQNDLKEFMGNVKEELSPYSAGNLIMTDDKAPVELLGMKVIDGLISEEVSYYKEVYKNDGIKGLIKELQ